LSTITVAAPDVETIARGRVDELVAVYGLPQPAHVHFCPDLWAGNEQGRRAVGAPNPAPRLRVEVARRADVEPWATFLGVLARTEQRIFENPDGRWCADWAVAARVLGWLPGFCDLTVLHDEQRWIDAPAVTS